jgi:hypothetical protein
MKTTTKELGNGIWNVKCGDRVWTGRAKDATDARNKAREMWLGR